MSLVHCRQWRKLSYYFKMLKLFVDYAPIVVFFYYILVSWFIRSYGCHYYRDCNCVDYITYSRASHSNNAISYRYYYSLVWGFNFMAQWWDIHKNETNNHPSNIWANSFGWSLYEAFISRETSWNINKNGARRMGNIYSAVFLFLFLYGTS